jgi:hypothetical protein
MVPSFRIFRAMSRDTGFSEHRTFDVTYSRMKGLTSVGEWLSLVEHLVRDQGVGGSNPLSPTNLFTFIYLQARRYVSDARFGGFERPSFRANLYL